MTNFFQTTILLFSILTGYSSKRINCLKNYRQNKTNNTFNNKLDELVKNIFNLDYFVLLQRWRISLGDSNNDGLVFILLPTGENKYN
jgi:hypothetical protein